MQDLYVSFGVSMDSTEIQALGTSGTSAAFIKFIDSAQFRFLGLRYNKGLGQWEFYDDQGNIVAIPAGVSSQAGQGFSVNFLNEASGLIRVDTYHGGLFAGSIPARALNLDHLLVGIVDHTGILANRRIPNIRVGAWAGGANIFNGTLPVLGLTAVPTMADFIPPYTSVNGFLTAQSPAGGVGLGITQQGAITASGPGTSDMYGLATIGVITFPPGGQTFPILTIPFDPPSNLIYIGDDDFKQSGPARWQLDGWNLDKVIVPVRGSIAKYDAYVAGLSRWARWSVDPNMYLIEWISDNHPQFPTIELQFIGKKDGIMPFDKLGENNIFQTVTGAVTARFDFSTGTISPIATVTLEYIAPGTTIRRWSKSRVDFAAVFPVTPPDVIPVWVASNFEVTPPNLIDAFAQAVNLYFRQRVVVTGTSEEMVPGSYFVVNVQAHTMLFPLFA